MSKLAAVDLLQPSPYADLFPHDEEHVERLREDIAARGIQTPLHVYPLEGGRFELLTGHDRLEAARRLEMDDVPIEVRSTLTTEEARFAYFVQDNTLRKEVDRRALATTVLRRYPEWSNRRIAQVAGCSEGTVRIAREEAEAAGVVRSVTHREGVDGVKQPAAKPERKAPLAATPSKPTRPAPPIQEEHPEYGSPEDYEPTTEEMLGSLADTAESLQEENQQLRAQVESLSAADLGAELRIWQEKYHRLAGRLQGETNALNTAKELVRRRDGLLDRIRKTLGIGRDDDIVKAVEELVQARQAART